MDETQVSVKVSLISTSAQSRPVCRRLSSQDNYPRTAQSICQNANGSLARLMNEDDHRQIRAVGG